MRPVMVLVLLFCGLLAAQQPHNNGPAMNPSPSAAAPDLTEAITARLFALWDAWKNHDAAVHNALLSDDYTGVYPDGTLHSGKPAAEVIAAAPISAYELTNLRVVPLYAERSERAATEAALVTYIAEVEIPGTPPAHGKFAVGEVWVKRGGQWLCRYYQGTLTK